MKFKKGEKDKKDETDEVFEFDPVGTCGAGPCAPRWLQKCIDIRIFIFAFVIYSASYGAENHFLTASLTNIEKAFSISSAKSGFITSGNDIGYLSMVVLVSFFATKVHKPRVLALCGILVGIGSIISSLPYFIFGGDMLDTDKYSSFSANMTEKKTPGLCSITNDTNQDTCGKKASVEENYKSIASYGIMLFGQLIIGVAASPVWSYGMTFIDDNSDKHKSPLYIGIMFGMRAVAPVVGFLLGGLFLKMPVNLKPTTLTPRHPSFVGAWWIGFFLFGLIIIVASAPLLLFPRQFGKRKKINKEEKIRNDDKNAQNNTPMLKAEENTDNDASKIDMKTNFMAVKRLFSNIPWLLHLLAGCVFFFTIIGSAIFFPKYSEKMFQLTPSQSGILIALSGALPFGLGSLLGGVFTSKLKLNQVQCAKWVTLISGISLIFYIFLIGFSCPQSELRGLEGRDNLNLSESCNIECKCTNVKYRPVCGSDGIQYFSPCQAGCSEPSVGQVFSNCSCIPDGIATDGVCRTECKMFIPFAVLLFLTKFIGVMSILPSIMLSMRLVAPHDKTIAVAIGTFCFTMSGLPAPSIFGAIIDSTCQLHDTCRSDLCQIYDMTSLRYLFFGPSIVFRVPSLLLHSAVWYILWKKHKKDETHNPTEEEMHVSMTDLG